MNDLIFIIYVNCLKARKHTYPKLHSRTTGYQCDEDGPRGKNQALKLWLKKWMKDGVNTLNWSERDVLRTMIPESNNSWHTKEDKKVTEDEGGEEDEGEERRRRPCREARRGDWLPVTSCWWYDGDRRLCETIEMTHSPVDEEERRGEGGRLTRFIERGEKW